MKKRNKLALVVPLLVSLLCGNAYAGRAHDDFVKGALAVGAAVIGVGAAAALVGWCCSETDDQMLARIDRECRAADAQYSDTMRYLRNVSGVVHYPADLKVLSRISEQVLFDFATMVWTNGSQLSSYRSSLNSTNAQLSASVNTLRKRIHTLEGKYCNYDDQKRLFSMRKLLNGAEQLNSDIGLFSQCLEHHKTYFNLYDTVGSLRNTHARQFAIVESAAYTDVIAYDLKNSILCCSNSRYPFKSFVNAIESDISRLRSDIRFLKYQYDARRYANLTLDQLVWMKNAIMTDGRYAQELYEYEQERLQRLRIEALEAQARVEQDRVNAMREQNRILERRNRIEQEKLWQKADNKFNKNADTQVVLEVTLF